MSLLYLVRHGQASFFAENYDRLSPLGELQARRLGEFFVRRKVRFDAVRTGPAVRQQTTAQIVVRTLNEAGIPCPEPVVIDGLNEHSGDKLLNKPQARALFEHHPELGPLEKAFREARDPDDVQKAFQKVFEAMVLRWTNDEFAVPGVELWKEFHERARGAFLSLVSQPGQGHGRTALAVSSVGPISVAVQTVLETSIPVALQLGWRLRNTGVTTFLHSPERVTLDSFNSLAHLENPAEITYR